MIEYKRVLYVDVVPDEKRNVTFYKKHGFQVMPEGTPLQIKGNTWGNPFRKEEVYAGFNEG